MKRIIGILLIVSLASFLQLNAQSVPKDGAAISIKESVINIAPGAEYEANVKLVRSKRYNKAKFGGLTSNVPKGLEIDFIQDAENRDLYKMKIKTSLDAELKAYTVLIKGQGNNAHKVKGIVVSVNLSGDQIVKTNN